MKPEFAKDRLQIMRDALLAVLLFHSASPWTDDKRARWRNLTNTDDATTRNLCDAVLLAIGRLPSCFGDLSGDLPSIIPKDFPLNQKQRETLKEMLKNPIRSAERDALQRLLDTKSKQEGF